MTPETAAAYSLLTAEAVRARAHRLLAIGLQDKLPHFLIDTDRLTSLADLVLAVTREAYPTLDVPFHSRWRQFVFAGKDRWRAVADSSPWRDVAARARAEFDLVITSVFLDAGAGPRWRFNDAATGTDIGRSEGLALASLAMFVDGAFSGRLQERLRADADRLRHITAADIARGFQVTTANPLVGLDGRADLLRRLGEVVAAHTDVFARADAPRPGGLFDHLGALAINRSIAAPTILAELLHHFGRIWPSRLVLGGVPLGDCWRHPAMLTADATNQLVPLHKLSQWLAYSLIEPMQRAGFTVTDIDGLTGLAEYRNGGLFIDSGVLVLRDLTLAIKPHEVGSPLVVEWRALTVALLDELAQVLRGHLDMDAATLPLAKILEGGTWAAGRRIACERRGDGSPPLQVVSDGTVF